MKIIVELYGATKDLSSKNFLEIDIKNNSTIQDVKFEIIKFIDKKFEGNKNLKQIIENGYQTVRSNSYDKQINLWKNFFN